MRNCILIVFSLFFFHGLFAQNNVGIGVTEPQTKLEVGGSNLSNYIRVSSINTRPNGIEFVREGTAGDWRWQNSNSFFDLYHVTNDFETANTSDILATFSNNGRLGIGTIDPLSELHIVGDIRSSNLAGNGERNVASNSAGELIIATPKTGYLMLSGWDFPDNTFGSTVFDFNTTTTKHAPVHLPHGAILTSFFLNYSDGSSSENLRVELLRYYIGSGSQPTITMVIFTTTGTPGNDLEFSTTSITNPEIDNLNYRYEVRVNEGTDYDFATNLSVRGVRFGYVVNN